MANHRIINRLKKGENSEIANESRFRHRRRETLTDGIDVLGMHIGILEYSGTRLSYLHVELARDLARSSYVGF